MGLSSPVGSQTAEWPTSPISRHRKFMEYEELSEYDTIYFCGGNSAYLIKRINETGFKTPLKKFVDNGGVGKWVENNVL